MTTYVWQVPLLNYLHACRLLREAQAADARRDPQRLGTLTEKLYKLGCPRKVDPRNDIIQVVPTGGRFVIKPASLEPLPGLPR